MTNEEIDGLRNTNRGLPLVLYLDLSDEETDKWLEDDCCTVRRRLSLALLKLIREAWGDDGKGLSDEASRAIELLVSCGPDRQAFIGPAIEGLLNTRPSVVGEPDTFKGYNEEKTKDRREFSRLARKERETKYEEPKPELDAAEVIDAWQHMLDEPESSAA